MRIGSLFSGYGGLDIAVSSVLGGQVAWHVEYDKAPSRILEHHYPDVPNYGDVTAVDFTTIEPVDVLTGGYPCQPFSHAGLRKGTDDDRHLWPHVLRAIREMGPRLVVLENVRGHITLGFDVVLSDLADLGWSARWGIVRASDAGAPHQRARLFIVAHPDSVGHEWCGRSRGRRRGLEDRRGAAADADLAGLEGTQSARGPYLPDGSPAADADLSSSQARGNTRHHSQRIRQQPVGLAAPTAYATSSERRTSKPEHLREASRPAAEPRECVAWVDYGFAIARWECVIGRPAPAPTEPGRTGNPRLAPRFVEWMMGLPDGWVTDPAIGISRNDQLKALGNGVVPQQAALALRHLLAA